MKVDFIIDGAPVGAASGATFTRRDPVTGAVASEAAAASEADAAKVVEAAERAFPAWSETGPGERRRLLLKAADLLEARTADFSKRAWTSAADAKESPDHVKWFSSDPDGNVFSHLACKQPINYAGYCNADFDRDLNDSRTTSDAAQREKFFADAVDHEAKDRPIIYLYHRKWLWAFTNKVSGFRVVPDGMIRLQGMKLG